MAEGKQQKKLVGTAIYGLYTAILKYVAAKGMVSSSLVCVRSEAGWSNGSWQRVSFCRKLISCSSLEFGLDWGKRELPLKKNEIGKFE